MLPGMQASTMLLLAGGLSSATAAAPGEPPRLVYRAGGPEAPAAESFEVRPERVDWRDDAGRLVARYDRGSGVLSLADPDTGTPLVMNDETLDTLAARQAEAARSLQQLVEALPRDEQPRARLRLAELLRPRGPWAAVEAVTAADARPALGRADVVAGLRCQWIGLEAGGRQVGQACVVPPCRVPGGDAVLQALQAGAAVLDALRARTPAGAPLGWPSHPLVAAARGGLLPVQVVQALPGEPRRVLELAAPAARP